MMKPEITNLKKNDPELFCKVALFIIAIDQIPPHIGLVINNKYFSYSTRGTIQGLELEKQIRKINRLRLASVLVEMDLNLDMNHVESVFSKLSVVESGKSCFLPIIEILKKEITIPNECKFLHQFIPYIHSMGKIINSYHLNAESILDVNDSIALNVYGQKEIDVAINKSRRHAKNR